MVLRSIGSVLCEGDELDVGDRDFITGHDVCLFFVDCAAGFPPAGLDGDGGATLRAVCRGKAVKRRDSGRTGMLRRVARAAGNPSDQPR